eukprot:CAMPEP_0179075934 /NCGR_PEP_ID=MMETSP0796-20121207/33843_1 /TAXON_ID=73915 /ORGANISM="Pyrodinium bahamense, Strain pbaha01" /LENGTH=410 /DNA_ID=CAMNT_0020773175 /DNA_START=67 /DNA_END=1299 /DNA_ORIENTATION=+
MAQTKQVNGALPRLPVIVLTGYLGAGKTTLLNYMLTEQRDKKLAVIENEIGEVSIDDALVQQKHQDMAEELVVLENGCVCCTIRGDLVKALLNIAAKRADGLALDGVLIELTGMADPAPVVQTFFIYPQVGQHFFIDNVVTLVDAKHAIEKLDESKNDPDEKGTASAQIAFSSCVLLNKIDLVEPAHLKSVEKRIEMVNSTAEIIRCEQARVPMEKLFGVGVFQLNKVLEEQYMDEEEFNSFYQPKMDRSVSNVGVRCTGAVSMYAFQDFLESWLGNDETAKDFLRVKGVLNIAGSDAKFVLQCVQMLKSQAFNEPWEAHEMRENRIIFIGRGMQQRRQALTEGFKACIAQPPRFAVGTRVKARMGEGEDDYEPGVVLAHWDAYNPYRIRIRGGGEVHAPLDNDFYVKAG